MRKDEQGVCPNCGAVGRLHYTSEDREDQMIGIEWTCPDCGARGVEWYAVVFSSQYLYPLPEVKP